MSIYREMRNSMARNSSFLIPRINSRDSEDFKKKLKPRPKESFKWINFKVFKFSTNLFYSFTLSINKINEIK